jgi:peptidoglycan/LPS O-acetylase OafA/YrhL
VSEPVTAPSSTLAIPPARAHDPAFDGLRGLAILLVMLYHFNVLHQPTTLGEAVWRGVMNTGWMGVDLFFVLSGYLITSILLDDKEREQGRVVEDSRRSSFLAFAGRFWARRVLRIFPLYYLFLFVSFVVLPRVAPIIGNGGITTLLPHEGWWFWLYLPNILFAQMGDFVGGRHFHLTWSLGVEEQFYFVWPVIVWLLDRRRLRMLVIALIVCALGWRVVMAARDAPWIAIFVLPYTRMDALAAGAFVALIGDDERRWLRMLARTIVALGLAYIVTQVYTRGQYAQFMPGVVTHGLTVNALFGAALLFSVRTSPKDGWWRRLFSLAGLRVFGRYAYGLYLVHIFVQHLLLGPLLDKREVQVFFGSRLLMQAAFTTACTIASLAIAALLFHSFEERFLRLKKHFRGPPAARVRLAVVDDASPSDAANGAVALARESTSSVDDVSARG